MSIIKDLLGNVGQTNPIIQINTTQKNRKYFFSDIGIIGDLGTSDLIKLIEIVIDYKKKQIIVPNMYYKNYMMK